LAAWNNLDNPNKILAGQVLRVAAPGDSAAAGTGVTTTPLKATTAVTEAKSGSGAGPGSAATTGTAGVPPTASPAARNADNYKSSPKAVKEPYSEQAVRDVARGAQAPTETVAMAAPAGAAKPEATRAAPPAAESEDEDRLDWVWPAKGKVVTGFSETANLKGIDIAGAAGEPEILLAACRGACLNESGSHP
jgi:lipoprotein NlpD